MLNRINRDQRIIALVNQILQHKSFMIGVGMGVGWVNSEEGYI